MASDNQRLDNLLNTGTQSSQLPSELSYIITSFVPSKSQDERSKAYLVLSAFCQGVRQSHSSKGQQQPTDGPDPATEALVKVFSPLILARLEEINEDDLLVGISFLTALFQVDWQSASVIFTQDTVLELIMDSIELKPSSQLSLSAAHLFSQACGYKPSRSAIPSEAMSWLERSRTSQDTALRAAASIALIKLAKGTAADSASNVDAATQEPKRTVDDELVSAMKQLIIDKDSNVSSLADAIEGLAYTSTDPIVKENISKDAGFLKQLFSLVPKQKSTPADSSFTLLYGIVVIITNVCAYRPQLTEEQKQIEKLKKMTKSNSEGSDSALDDDDKVKDRIKRLMTAGALEVLVAAALHTDTVGVRLSVGKALLDIVTEKDNRGKVLQHGGAKILMSIIKKAMSADATSKPAKDVTLNASHFPAIQALAKLAITSSPVQVFGPNIGAVYDAIRPLSLMLQHPSATQLQRFESLMALTNLASASPESATRIADSKELLNRVELLLLDDHPLVQRASVELVCNLIVGCDKVFETYASSKSKLQIILALSDAEDLQARLAASGALATLLSLPSACEELLSLQRERHRVLPILTQLIDPSSATDGEPPSESHPGLVHRGVICARHFLLSIDEPSNKEVIRKEAKEAGLVDALGKIVKDSSLGPEIVRPAVESLKYLIKDVDK